MNANQPNTSTLSRRPGKAWLFVLLALVLAGGGVALYLVLRNKDVDDFDLVPRDALAFVTIRVADVLESDAGKNMLTSIERIAGNDFQKLRVIEGEIGLKLTDVERVTLVVNGAQRDGMWAIVHTKKDIDKDKVLALIEKFADKATEKKHEGRAYYTFGPDREGAICFLSSRQAVLSTAAGMEKCLEVAKKGPGKGPLEDAVKLAGENYQLVAAANVGDILKLPGARTGIDRDARREGVDGEMARVFLEVKRATYTCKVEKKFIAELSAEFADDAAAKKAVAALERGLDKVRAEVAKEPRIPPEMKPVVDALEQLKPKQAGSVVSAKVEVDGEPFFTSAMFLFKRMPAKPKSQATKGDDSEEPPQPPKNDQQPRRP